MKPYNLSILVCLVLAFASFSCKKDNNPTPTPAKPDSTMHVNLSYPATIWQTQSDSVKNFELLISEAGGKYHLFRQLS